MNDLTTNIVALVGMTLGIYNFWRARKDEQVQLLVVPKALHVQDNGPGGKGINWYNSRAYEVNHPTAPAQALVLEVINIGKFTVTVDEVGFKVPWARRRMAVLNPDVIDHGSWPRKLEPRERPLIRFEANQLLAHEDIGRVTRAYAATACESTCYGKSGALRQFVRVAWGSSRSKHAGVLRGAQKRGIR